FARSPALSVEELSQRAGLIFTGTVVKIEPSDQDSTVRITFKIEDAIRGVRSGGELTTREWAGNWATAPRYRAGEKLLLFLHGPARGGAISPVGGDAGIFRYANGSF